MHKVCLWQLVLTLRGPTGGLSLRQKGKGYLFFNFAASRLNCSASWAFSRACSSRQPFRRCLTLHQHIAILQIVVIPATVGSPLQVESDRLHRNHDKHRHEEPKVAGCVQREREAVLNHPRRQLLGNLHPGHFLAAAVRSDGFVPVVPRESLSVSAPVAESESATA